jgi:hypothetical protein
MKDLTAIAVAVMFYASCMPAQYSRSERSQKKEAYVYSFKMTYFKKMLLAGFGNSYEIKSIVNEDHGGYGEMILSMPDLRFIDSIVAADKAKILADSAASIGRVAEGADGKRVFDRALIRYQSKWLNGVAKKRSRAYIGINPVGKWN